MSLTEKISTDDLARSLFDEVVVPLARARKTAGRPEYFARVGEVGAASYFESPRQALMPSSDFEFPGGGTADGLIDALAAYWKMEGEDGLAVLVPGLKKIAEALREEAQESDGHVDILCYTMF